MKIINQVKKFGKKIMGVAVAMATIVATAVVTFAADGSEYVAIQASDLEPILEGAKANAAVVIPVGVGLFIISFGIGFAIGILKKFKKG